MHLPSFISMCCLNGKSEGDVRDASRVQVDLRTRTPQNCEHKMDYATTNHDTAKDNVQY